MDLAEETLVKHLLAFLFALAIVSIGVGALLLDRAGTRPVPVQPKPPEPERFEGSAETLSPEELHRAKVRNTPTLEDLRAAEEYVRESHRQDEILRARPRSKRLPPGHKWGRCLLVVAGETRISGLCAYHMKEGGSFDIDGPRQVYAGIDFPKPVSEADNMSNDYWAGIYRERDGGWTGYGNSHPLATHGDPDFGPLRRRGPCFVGKMARVCLWKTPPGSRRSKPSKTAGGGSTPETAAPLPTSDTTAEFAIAAARNSATPDRP
jgi:hypothetical protein